MIDINLIRTNPDLVKENMKKKFQDHKLEFVDSVLKLDEQNRAIKQEGDNLRSLRNKLSESVGQLMRDKKFEEAETIKKQVVDINEKLVGVEKEEQETSAQIYNYMSKIPNIIADDVPIGKSDAENVQRSTFGNPRDFNFEIPYHVDILEKLEGLDLDSARRISGNGFYFLTGNIARLHSAILSYARDFMINKGFTYVIPPFMIREDVVNGVMSFEEMNNMMYKIEGEDLYLIGTSEHSMIGKFKGQMLEEKDLPIMLTSYSPCFRKEVGAHGIEERGIYRVHQFEKQEMIVICKPEDSMDWYHKMYNISVDFFKSLDVPGRVLESCSGDLADLKVKGCDVEAWSPRQNIYFGELGSCSNLGDAQSRRLNIKYKTDKDKLFVHTLNNTVVAPPRALIYFLENNLNEDGSVNVPKVLQPYMGGLTKIDPKK